MFFVSESYINLFYVVIVAKIRNYIDKAFFEMDFFGTGVDSRADGGVRNGLPLRLIGVRGEKKSGVGGRLGQ